MQQSALSLVALALIATGVVLGMALLIGHLLRHIEWQHRRINYLEGKHMAASALITGILGVVSHLEQSVKTQIDEVKSLVAEQAANNEAGEEVELDEINSRLTALSDAVDTSIAGLKDASASAQSATGFATPAPGTGPQPVEPQAGTSNDPARAGDTTAGMPTPAAPAGTTVQLPQSVTDPIGAVDNPAPVAPNPGNPGVGATTDTLAQPGTPSETPPGLSGAAGIGDSQADIADANSA